MKLPVLLVASLFALSPGVAYAHHEHQHSDSNTVGDVLALALIGTGIYLGSREYDHNHHHRDYYHRRRHRRARVIDEYRYRGDNYRICRRGSDVFYC